jgi:hypothetical protein
MHPTKTSWHLTSEKPVFGLYLTFLGEPQFVSYKNNKSNQTFENDTTKKKTLR